MQTQTLNDRQRAFVLAAFLVEKGNALDLIPFLSPEEQGLLEAALKRLSEKESGQKTQVIQDELRRLLVESRRGILADIHPDWIVKALKDESPQMIATVMRYLPGDKVNYVLRHLPNFQDMPTLSQTFALDPELARLIRRRLEEQFANPFNQIATTKKLNFETMHLLPPAKLKRIFLELGVREIALALSTLSPNTVDALLNHLPPEDSAVLRDRLQKVTEVPKDRLKQAQGHLVALDIKKQDPKTLILEAGFYVYSKSVMPKHSVLWLFVRQKFPMTIADLMQGYIDKNLPLNSDQSVARYQKEIEEILISI